jgi:aspartate racemase
MLGVIGGMGWESTGRYYRLLNEAYARRHGEFRSVPCLLCSVDFAPLLALQRAGRWKDFEERMVEAGARLVRAGATHLLLASNTAHAAFGRLARELEVPTIHTVDVVLARAREERVERLGLLGTRTTMERLYPERTRELREPSPWIVPEEPTRARLDEIIYEELARGVFLPESLFFLRRSVDGLVAQGARVVLLACGELPLVLPPDGFEVPLWDAMRIHAEAAVERVEEGRPSDSRGVGPEAPLDGAPMIR